MATNKHHSPKNNPLPRRARWSLLRGLPQAKPGGPRVPSPEPEPEPDARGGRASPISPPRPRRGLVPARGRAAATRRSPQPDFPQPRPRRPRSRPTHCTSAEATRPGDAGGPRARARGRESPRPAAAAAAAEGTTEPEPGVAAPAARRGRRLLSRVAAPRTRTPPIGGAGRRPGSRIATGTLGAAGAAWSGGLCSSPEAPPPSRSYPRPNFLPCILYSIFMSDFLQHKVKLFQWISFFIIESHSLKGTCLKPKGSNFWERITGYQPRRVEEVCSKLIALVRYL